MSNPKRQHWAPECYLKAWLDPGRAPADKPYLWRIDRETRAAEALSVDQVCVKTHLYTIRGSGGEKDYAIERALSELEGPYERTVTEKVIPGAPLEPRDRANLIVFAAAMFARTPAQRDHIGGQWAHIVRVAEDMERAIKEATPGRRVPSFPRVESGGGPSLTLDDARRIAEHPLQHSIAPMLRAAAPILAQMHLAVLTTDSAPGFITSDDPLAVYDPTAYRRPPMYRSPGLSHQHVEVTLPLAPNRLLILTWERLAPDTYFGVPDRLVDETNRRTQFHADRHIISRAAEIRAIWFEEREPPPDAWENRQKR
jgi:hypothetical protein